jgi:hypothetical protein
MCLQEVATGAEVGAEAGAEEILAVGVMLHQVNRFSILKPLPRCHCLPSLGPLLTCSVPRSSKFSPLHGRPHFTFPVVRYLSLHAQKCHAFYSALRSMLDFLLSTTTVEQGGWRMLLHQDFPLQLKEQLVGQAVRLPSRPKKPRKGRWQVSRRATPKTFRYIFLRAAVKI